MGRGLDKPQTIMSLTVRKQKILKKKNTFCKAESIAWLSAGLECTQKENNDHRKGGSLREMEATLATISSLGTRGTSDSMWKTY